MQLLIAFLLFSFIVASTQLGQRFARRPLLQLAVCAAVGLCFYSIRVIQ